MVPTLTSPLPGNCYLFKSNLSSMKYAIQILVFASMLITAIGCKEDYSHIPINSELKKSYGFNLGSYWIYKDALTGDVDSFYVSGYDHNPSLWKNHDQTYESLIIRITQFKPKYPSEQIEWFYELKGNTMTMSYAYYGYGASFDDPEFAVYPFNYNIPSLTINGNQYERIAEINHTNSNPYQRFDDVFYLKDGVGFVKIDLNYDYNRLHYVYELQRYHINN